MAGAQPVHRGAVAAVRRNDCRRSVGAAEQPHVRVHGRPGHVRLSRVRLCPAGDFRRDCRPDCPAVLARLDLAAPAGLEPEMRALTCAPNNKHALLMVTDEPPQAVRGGTATAGGSVKKPKEEHNDHRNGTPADGVRGRHPNSWPDLVHHRTRGRRPADDLELAHALPYADAAPRSDELPVRQPVYVDGNTVV